MVVIQQLRAEIFVDASAVGKRPTELAWVFAPEVQRGAWAPPLARALSGTQWLTIRDF